MPGGIAGCASGIPGALADLHDDLCVEPQLPHRQRVHHGHGQPAGVLPAIRNTGPQPGDGRRLDVRPAGHPCWAPVSSLLLCCLAHAFSSLLPA